VPAPDVQPESSLPEPVLEALRRARLLALDVDGTLTDGRVVYVGAEELQAFCVHDGAGLAWLRGEGVLQTWITGRGSEPTRRRAAELGVEELHTGVRDKTATLADVQERLGIAPEETIAMGDDLADFGLAERAALLVAPADARPEVRERAGLVTRAAAGHGAVRELVETMLRVRGRWDARVGR
jgi:3-deoxy-D-manno-octulosonate 8-phosphate phosphatase (KDO 8-P phosphatase)